jgi:Retroviral aspartyl protease
MPRAIFPQAVFIPNQQSLYVSVSLHSAIYHDNVAALIDSGATNNFISVELARDFKIPSYKLDQPCIIHNVDGTRNSRGSIDTTTMLMIKYNNQITEHMFYHINLGDDHMLFGMPFLAATNPNIDWTNGTFEGKVIAATKDAYKWSLHDRSKPIFVYPEKHPDSQHYRPHFPAYMHFKPDDYAFIDKPQEPICIRRTTKSMTLAAEALDKNKCTWQEQVPLEYYHFGKVFSKEESQRLPGSRPWDHAIDLIAKAPPMLDCKTYPLASG